MKTFEECKQEAIDKLGYTKLFDLDDFSRNEYVEITDLAAKIYATQALDAAAKSIHYYESGEKRKVMCNTILKLKDQLK